MCTMPPTLAPESSSGTSHSTVKIGKLWVQGQFSEGATSHLHLRLILAGNR